jgi:hypothetical protein
VTIPLSLLGPVIRNPNRLWRAFMEKESCSRLSCSVPWGNRMDAGSLLGKPTQLPGGASRMKSEAGKAKAFR